MTRDVFVLAPRDPADGRLVAYNKRDAPRYLDCTELTSHARLGTDFLVYLHAFVEGGFSHADFADYSELPAPPPEPIVDDTRSPESLVRGDVVEIGGIGYGWVTRVASQAEASQVKVAKFATLDGHPTTMTTDTEVPLLACRKLTEDRRAELVSLIPSDIRSFLPSDRPRG